jgi:anti-sigma factor RsiW
VNHRHLLPNEIDLLLDDEVGFGIAPLRAHVRDCAECRVRVDEARVVVDTLEELPHFAPSFDFANRVMAQVPVFEPWHVAAREAVMRWVPQSRPARVAALAFGSAIATVLTVAIVWLGTQTELVAFTGGAIGSRVRDVGYEALRDVVVTLFGDQAFVAVQHLGLLGLGLVAVGLLVTTAASVFGFRALATASSRRRG